MDDPMPQTRFVIRKGFARPGSGRSTETGLVPGGFSIILSIFPDGSALNGTPALRPM